jgi:hypothetical protein
MSKIFMVFVFLFSTLFAKEASFPFIGVSFSSDTVNLLPIVTAAPNRLKNPASVEADTFGLQYGMQTLDYRTTFSIAGNSDYKSFDVEVDYILFDSMFGMPEIRPYVGATLGYINYDKALITRYNENRIQANLDADKNTTISSRDGYYGLNAGLLFYITDDIDMDVSYHYYVLDRLTPLDNMQGIKFSLHYFY